MLLNGRKPKIVCVADHFLVPSFYEECLKMFPDVELIGIPWFGSNTRNEIRKQVDKIEKEGADAFDPPAELFEMIKDADLLMTHLCPVPRKLLEASPILPDGTRKLKYILANRGGLENLDVQAAKDLGIPILNNPAHNGNAVAEMTIALMVMETRNLARAHHSLMQGEWLEIFPNVGQVYELRRKTIGIVGYGTIGRLVAEKLQPFNVRILAYDINPAVFEDDPDLEKWGVEIMPDMDTLLKESDIVTLHVRTNKEQIFAKREFDLMKPTAYFINTARVRDGTFPSDACFYKLHGDEDPWRIVVENLVDNALRYARTTIRIELHPGELSVINDGSQISEDRMGKLFKAYEKGTDGQFGLGLSIVYKVCSTYGYHIEAENLADGVKFHIWKELPAKARKALEKEKKQEAREKARSSRKAK